MNTIGGLRTLRHRRGALVTSVFTAAAYNIVRLRRSLATAWAHGARYETTPCLGASVARGSAQDGCAQGKTDMNATNSAAC